MGWGWRGVAGQQTVLLGLYASSSYQAQTCLPGLKGLVSTCKISFAVEVKDLKKDPNTHEGSFPHGRASDGLDPSR